MSIHCKIWCFCILLFCLPQVLRGTVEVRSIHMTTHDGIANNSIRCIYQDSKGFIWMGTLNGLSRYDGNNFLNFHPEANKPSLADHRIRRIDEDRNGFLWINSITELYSCYDLKHGCFVDFTGCGEYTQRYGDKLQASNGDIWLWHKSNGCRRVRWKDGRFTSVTFKKETGSLPSNHVAYIYEDEQSRIWIGTNKGVVLVEGDDGRTTQVVSVPNAYKACSFEGKMFFISSEGVISRLDEENRSAREVARISNADGLADGLLMVQGVMPLLDDWYIFTSTGGYKFNYHTCRLEPAGQLDIPNGHVMRDNRGDYWICNNTGSMWYVNTQTQEVRQFRFMDPDKMGYIDRERYNIVHDSRDIIWVSTYGNGLFAYDLHTGELQHFTASIDGSSHIRSNYLQYVMEDSEQGIWISSEFAGVSRLSVLNGSVRRLYPSGGDKQNNSNIIRVATYMMGDGQVWVSTRSGDLFAYDKSFEVRHREHFAHSNIYAVAEDSNGKLWLGSRGNGLCIDGVWYKRNKNDTTALSFDHIFSLYCDSKRRMWVGTFGGGLDLAIPQQDGSYTFRHFLTKAYGQRQVRAIAEDDYGRIWAGTSDGVYVLSADLEEVWEFSSRNETMKSNEVRCIYKDRAGRMWLGTAGAGLCVCHPGADLKQIRFEHYNTNDGLVNDIVQSILEDRDGHFWISTEYGISCFILPERSFRNYFFSAYELGNVYTENSGCLLPDGNLLFGSNYGLIVFDPLAVKSTRALDSFGGVTLTSLHVNGAEIRPDMPGSLLSNDIAYTDKIRLGHKQNSFTVYFSTFNYSPENEANYTYKLENYDEAWNAPSAQNFAMYRNLPPGNYTLRVRACKGATDMAGGKETVLDIVIRPPFYQTTAAYAVYFFFLLLIVGLSLRTMHKFNVLRNRIEVEKQLTEYKLMFFTNISHEYRTPLTLIRGALERLAEMKQKIPRELLPSLKIMEKNTVRLLRLIDQLLEFRKMQGNKLALSLEETDVMKFLYEIYLNFRDMAESKKIDFRYLPSTETYSMYIDRGNVDKVAYNLLSNAFKYTPANGRIYFRVNVREEMNRLEISVADSGVGIPKEKRGELFSRFMQSSFSADSVGVGLHLTHELVSLHKGTITYSENEGGGSIFTVMLPLNADVYEQKDFLKPSPLQAAKPEASFLKDDTEPSMPAEDDAKPSAATLNEHRVLIIDDDDDIRRFLAEDIGQYFKVRVASDGKSGLEEARVYNPDLIICDVLMPDMNGFEVTRRLKEDFNTSHIPIVLLTALDSPEMRLKGVKQGADLYIGKPFSMKYLLACIKNLIGQRDKLRAKFFRDLSVQANALITSKSDQNFLDELNAYIEQRIADPDLSLNDLANAMHLGKTTLSSKVSGITGYPPIKYIRLIRLRHAAKLLKEQTHTVSEVCYMVGFSDPYYFSKCFKQQFGVPPSSYGMMQADGEKDEQQSQA